MKITIHNKAIRITLFTAAALAVLIALFFVARTPVFGLSELAQKDNPAWVGAAKAVGVSIEATDVLDACTLDADGDGNMDASLLLKGKTGNYGDELIIVALGKTPKLLYRGSFAHLNPWKVSSGDVDGDKTDELSLGVFTKAKFHPEYAKRPFFYSLVNNDLHPKWLGSRLSRPFDDYAFSDMDGDGADELIAIETNRNNEAELNVYHWKGFGFESLGTSAPYCALRCLVTNNGKVSVLAKAGLFWRWITFDFKPDGEPSLTPSF